MNKQWEEYILPVAFAVAGVSLLFGLVTALW